MRNATVEDLTPIRALLKEFNTEVPGILEDGVDISFSFAQRYVAGALPGVVLYEPEQAVLIWGDANVKAFSALGKFANGYGLFVRPAFRGAGLAATLIKEAIDQLRGLDFHSIVVSYDVGNEASRLMLERAEFEPVQVTTRLRLRKADRVDIVFNVLSERERRA